MCNTREAVFANTTSLCRKYSVSFRKKDKCIFGTTHLAPIVTHYTWRSYLLILCTFIIHDGMNLILIWMKWEDGGQIFFVVKKGLFLSILKVRVWNKHLVFQEIIYQWISWKYNKLQKLCMKCKAALNCASGLKTFVYFGWFITGHILIPVRQNIWFPENKNIFRNDKLNCVVTISLS